jgi:hypothetical protein
MDGSSEDFVEAFEQAGIRPLAVKRRYIRVLKPIRVEKGGSWAEFLPYDGTRFEIEIDFDSKAIGRQIFAADIDPGVFKREISRARTFGFMKERVRDRRDRTPRARPFGGIDRGERAGLCAVAALIAVRPSRLAVFATKLRD